MRILNITALAKDLANDEISEKKGMHYFLASSLLILFVTYYSMWWGVVRDWIFYFELVIVAVITVFGCLNAFEANGGNEGRDFVKRAVCLSVPAGVRVNVVSVLFGLGLYLSAGQIFTSISFGDPSRAYMLISYAGFVGFNIYFWWLLVNGFQRVLQHGQKT
ncbi:MAG: hypothetical protein ACH253_10220 [Candidatus Thiodiazotropha sp.]